MSIDDSLRRIANQAFFDKLIVLPDDGIDSEPGEPFNVFFNPEVQALAVRRQGQTGESRHQTADVGGLNNDLWVEAMERCGNRRPRVERLVSAWNQGTRGGPGADGDADDPLIGASAEPKKRPRTRLTDSEVDAMRTARAQGVSSA